MAEMLDFVMKNSSKFSLIQPNSGKFNHFEKKICALGAHRFLCCHGFSGYHAQAVDFHDNFR
jgi:hypothetical protein